MNKTAVRTLAMKLLSGSEKKDRIILNAIKFLLLHEKKLPDNPCPWMHNDEAVSLSWCDGGDRRIEKIMIYGDGRYMQTATEEIYHIDDDSGIVNGY